MGTETKDIKALEKRAAELRAVVEQPSEKEEAAAELRQVEAQLNRVEEENARAERERQLLADKRAYGSLVASLEQDAERARNNIAEAAEAIERWNARYISACERREAIIAAGGEAPPPPTAPARLASVKLPVLREYPPRKRMNLRRTPEQIQREQQRRREEWERVMGRDTSGVASETEAMRKLPSNVPAAGTW